MSIINIATLYAEAELAPKSQISKRVISRRYSKDGQISWKQVLLNFNITTRNGNNFKQNEFVEAVASESVQQRLRGKRLYGELDHPSKEDFDRFTTVSLKEISHRINDLWFEGTTLYGEFETTNSPNGDIVRAMIEQDAEIAASFRGYGIPKPEGGENIVITTWDIVYHPSDPNALSDENTFRNKMYAEGASQSQIVASMYYEGLTNQVPISKNSHVYAESSQINGIIPDQIIYSKSGQAIGFTFETVEEKALKATTNNFRNFIKGI